VKENTLCSIAEEEDFVSTNPQGLGLITKGLFRNLLLKKAGWVFTLFYKHTYI
jgi:hypothetical protein